MSDPMSEPSQRAKDLEASIRTMVQLWAYDEFKAMEAIQAALDAERADALRYAAELSRIAGNFHTGQGTQILRAFAERLDMEVKALAKRKASSE